MGRLTGSLARSRNKKAASRSLRNKDDQASLQDMQGRSTLYSESMKQHGQKI